MKKLLALTAVIGSTVAIAGCNNTPSVDTLFKDFEKTDVEKYLTIALDQITTYADTDGYVMYDDYMGDAAVSKHAITLFLDAAYPKFDKKEIGGKIDADVTVANKTVHFNGEIRKMNSQNTGYEFDIALTGAQEGSIYLGLERVNNFTNATVLMTLGDDTVIYNKFTETNFMSIDWSETTGDDDVTTQSATYNYISHSGGQNTIHHVNVQDDGTDEVTSAWRAISNSAFGITTSTTNPGFNDKGVAVIADNIPQSLKDALAADVDATMDGTKLAKVKIDDIDAYLVKLTKDIAAE